MGFPLYVTCCFSLAAFNILSLCLVIVSLISMRLGVFLLGFILYGTLCLLDLIDYFFFHVGEIFNYNLFKKFLIPLVFLFFFWNPYNSNIGVFDIVPEVSETVISCFHSFYFILLFRSYLHHFTFGEGNGNPLQYYCLENPMDKRSLVGYSPWGCKESDTTERLHFTSLLPLSGMYLKKKKVIVYELYLKLCDIFGTLSINISVRHIHVTLGPGLSVRYYAY